MVWVGRRVLPHPLCPGWSPVFPISGIAFLGATLVQLENYLDKLLRLSQYTALPIREFIDVPFQRY